MAQTIADLVALGLTENEAKRIVNRKAKEAEKSASQIATAEKRLPKIQADLDHAADRAKHWTDRAAELQAKVDKYVAVISGESTEDIGDEDEAPAEPEPEAPAKPARGKK